MFNNHDRQSQHTQKNPGKMDGVSAYFIFMNKIFQEIRIYRKETLMLNYLQLIGRVIPFLKTLF